MLRRLVRGVTTSAYFLLAFAQIPIFTGYFLMGDCLPAIIMLAALLPLSFLLSLLPGKVGGKKKKEEVIERTSRSGNDPDPDRDLRNEGMPVEDKRRSFPLRAVVCALVCLLIVITIFVVPAELLGGVSLVQRLVLSLVMVAMLPLALKMVALGEGGSACTYAGIILYVISGVVLFFAMDPVLNEWLAGFGLAFLIAAAFSSNNTSLRKGATVRSGVRPPASMRRMNRVLLLFTGIVGGLILYFDKIKTAVTTAGQYVVSLIWNLFVLITSFGGGDDQGGESVIPTADISGGEGELPNGDESLIALIFEKIAIGLVIIILLFLLYLALKKIIKGVVKIVRVLLAKFRKLGDAMSEEYQDEQESLFSWQETRDEMAANLRKRLNRLRSREKKWDEMDVRERVRYVVRALYRKAHDGS